MTVIGVDGMAVEDVCLAHKPKSSTLRWRRRWKLRKAKCKLFQAIPNNSLRPYAKIMLFGTEVLGVVYTEASVAWVAFATIIFATKPPLEMSSLGVQIADGFSPASAGRISVATEFRGQPETCTFIGVQSMPPKLLFHQEDIPCWFPRISEVP